MRKINRLSVLCAMTFAISSCYKDYIEDYDFSAVYFSSQKPLRTVIADRNMKIRVGVAVAGKRNVDVNDWAMFEIDPALLDGTGLQLLPSDCYTLSDESYFRNSNPNLPIADVEISFTDKFYQNAASSSLHYALPFKVIGSSADSILTDKSYSIVAIKYISNYHGTYYVKGEVSIYDDKGQLIETNTYSEKDLSKNITRDVLTVNTNTIYRTGVANLPLEDNENVRITVKEKNLLELGTFESGIAITSGSGTCSVIDGRLQMNLEYTFEKDGKKYAVKEILVRRQDPANDLRFEEW